MSDERLVPVHVAGEQAEAGKVKEELASYGVLATVEKRHGRHATFEYQVLVREKDQRRAKELLVEKPTGIDEADVDPGPCPKCGETDTVFFPVEKSTTTDRLFPTFLKGRKADTKFLCNRCGHRWSD